MINTNATRWEISAPEKTADWDLTKAIFDNKTMLEGHEKPFIHCQGTRIGIDIDFHQLWDKTVAPVGWFHLIGGQCIIMLSIVSMYGYQAIDFMTDFIFYMLLDSVYYIKSWNKFMYSNDFDKPSKWHALLVQVAISMK